MPEKANETGVLSKEEQAALKLHVRQLKAAKKRKNTPADDLSDVLESIEAMPEPDRSIAKKIHQIVTEVSPELLAKTWYGMPAYAINGKVICFFQNAEKFKTRYATLGFSDSAKLDDGQMWPNSYAVSELNEKVEKQIKDLVTRAIS